MLTTITVVAGGIGLFLLGMILLTDGLKAIAGDALRRVLARFTGNRFSAVATGCIVTLIVQSSTATTLATISFVSAGLLAFNNAIGVVIGANVGTTSIGWIVSLLGLKFSIASFAMPMVGIGALIRLLGRDRIAEVGNVIAGFGLIFFGIDVLQDGMDGLGEKLDLAQYSAAGLGSRLILVGIGIAMTVIMQSSSASMVTTLTAVASGTIGLDQAAALVIGHHIGTTGTAVLAAIGASVQAKRTALVHVVFNVVTAVIVFALLPWLVDLLQRLTTDEGSGADQALVIAAFHTGFALLGALIFIPLVPQLAQFAAWVLPERETGLTRQLDPGLRDVPALAVAATVSTLRQVLAQVFEATGQALVDRDRVPDARIKEWQGAIEAAGELVARLRGTDKHTVERLTSTLHLLDHVRQLVDAVGKPAHYRHIDSVSELHDHAAALGQLFAERGQDMGADGAGEPEPLPGTPLKTLRTLRSTILSESANGHLDSDQVLQALATQRWLERLNHHARRALHYLGCLGGQAQGRSAKATVADTDEPGPDEPAAEQTAA